MVARNASRPAAEGPGRHDPPAQREVFEDRLAFDRVYEGAGAHQLDYALDVRPQLAVEVHEGGDLAHRRVDATGPLAKAVRPAEIRRLTEDQEVDRRHALREVHHLPRLPRRRR